MLYICQEARWSFPFGKGNLASCRFFSIGGRRVRDSGLWYRFFYGKKKCLEFLEFKNKRRENRYGDELENLNSEKDPQCVNGLLLYWWKVCCLGQYGSLDQKHQHQNSGKKAQQSVFISPQMIPMPPSKVAPSAMGIKLVLKNRKSWGNRLNLNAGLGVKGGRLEAVFFFFFQVTSGPSLYEWFKVLSTT